MTNEDKLFFEEFNKDSLKELNRKNKIIKKVSKKSLSKILSEISKNAIEDQDDQIYIRLSKISYYEKEIIDKLKELGYNVQIDHGFDELGEYNYIYIKL